MLERGDAAAEADALVLKSLEKRNAMSQPKKSQYLVHTKATLFGLGVRFRDNDRKIAEEN